HRGLGWRVAADGGPVADPLRCRWDRRTAGSPSRGGPRAGSGLDPGPRAGPLTDLAAGRVGPVALVVAGTGRVHRPHRGSVHLAPLRGETVAGQRNPAAPA